MPVDVPVSPSLVTEAFEDSVSTSQFNAPEGSLIVAAWAGMFEVDEISGGNLTWTERVVSVDIRTMIFTATVPTARNLRVTASGDFFIQGGLKVWLVTGQHPTSPIGNINDDLVNANAPNVNVYTATEAGSLGFCVAFEETLTSTQEPTSPEVYEAYSMRDIYDDPGHGIFMRKAAGASAAGQPVTFSWDAPGSQNIRWEWAALEILPAPGERLAVVHQSVAAVHRAAAW